MDPELAREILRCAAAGQASPDIAELTGVPVADVEAVLNDHGRISGPDWQLTFADDGRSTFNDIKREE